MGIQIHWRLEKVKHDSRLVQQPRLVRFIRGPLTCRGPTLVFALTDNVLSLNYADSLLTLNGNEIPAPCDIKEDRKASCRLNRGSVVRCARYRA